MNKKLIRCIVGILVIIFSMFLGWFIGNTLFPTAFVVCNYYGSTVTYGIRFGQIQASTMGLSTNPEGEPLRINLDGIHSTAEAVKEIERQVKAQGGSIDSIIQGV